MKEKKKTIRKKPQPLPRLRDLDYSPDFNPLLEPEEIRIKRRRVRAARSRELLDPETGELSAISTVHTIEYKDDAEFVKVFAEGVKAIYELSRTGKRVFEVILDEYQRTPMNTGYVDSIYLAWFDNGLSGRSVGMSEATFNRGLRELVAKGFLALKTPNVFWVNPSLFFKGNRVAFIKEYRRRQTEPELEEQRDSSLEPPEADL